MTDVAASDALPLHGRCLLVVGASSGIGRAFAVAAASLGARVACAARSQPGVEATAAAAGDGPAIVADVTSPDDCERIATEAVEALGALDAVLYTPAPGLHLRLRDHDTASWDAQLRPILVGASAITRAVLPHLAPKGVVAYLSSVATRWSPHTQYGMAGYAASKAALETMIRGWQAEEPGFRFTSVVIGSTVGVSRREQHQQDPQLEAEIRRRLEGGGVLGQGYMTSDDLGRFLAEAIALLLAHPGIAAPELVLEPSGRSDAGG
jgi:NAD(P)-dependent dehydrogenase (short-subunit alcohol dehydrogenase family)